MKHILKILTLAVVAITSNAFAGTTDCFEREWIVSENSPKISLQQLEQAIKVQIPLLAVTSDSSNILVVAYQPAKNSTVQQDKSKLTQSFEQISAMGFNVQCNSVVDPLPSMTGVN